jgi:hypothetical protein
VGDCWLWSLIIFLIQRSLLSAMFIPHEVFTPRNYVHSSMRGSAEEGYPLYGIRATKQRKYEKEINQSCGYLIMLVLQGPDGEVWDVEFFDYDVQDLVQFLSLFFSNYAQFFHSADGQQLILTQKWAKPL